jgi:DNA-binding transcriptional ArsR family regulator
MVAQMLPGEDMPLDVLEDRVEEAVRMLRLLANERRLMVLCHLLGRGEMNVGSLADLVGLSQPALSQHLAQMRAEGLVATRREAQTIWYRVADPKVARLVDVLHEMFCPQL